MNSCKSPILIFCISGIIGCSSIPDEFRQSGATFLEKCPDNMDISLFNDKGALLTSIVVHTMDRNTWYFLLKEESTRSKYLFPLQPSRVAFQWGSYKSQPRSHCYVVQPGRYQFVKAYNYRAPNGHRPGRVFEYDYTGHVQIQAGKVSYIGQLLIEDPRAKDKGFWSQWFAMLLAFPNSHPEDLEFSSTDESDADMAWLEKHTRTHKPSVVSAVDF